MQGLGKRVVILAAFGAGFALVLLVAMAIQAALRTARPSLGRKTPATSVKSESTRPAPLALPPATPAAPTPNQNTATNEQASLPPEETEEAATLEQVFHSTDGSENGEIDQAQIERSLRAFVEQSRPRLKLSDADYERLAGSIMKFREANVRMRSMERTGMNSAGFRQALDDVNEATDEFVRITGMSPGEFFVGKDAPVKFGDDPRGAIDDEVVTEYLPESKP